MSSGYTDLRQIGHHDIGADIAQRLRVPAAIDADDAAESTGAPGLDAGDRVLHDDGTRRFCPNATRRLYISIRCWLALEHEAGDVHPVHSRVEQLVRYPLPRALPRSCCWRTRRRS